MADNNKKNILIEFKEFISRGNVLDMAVGVIVGGAFTSIVNSLVNDIFTPFLGMILAGVNFDSLGVTIPWGNQPYINFGSFIQSVVSFLLTALCVFLLVKTINKFRRKKEEPAPEPAPEPKPSAEELLLREIRDLLKEQNRTSNPDNNRNNNNGHNRRNNNDKNNRKDVSLSK
ncbi:MAG: large-conductance mechanosensitive channel protein MscL [Oscillospiraceae bacterium]|nr:large-conductance mechanosensitive channel protein MscL [Oscillospiraceae bacterium]